jgi:excisionase family DNA binding protein
LHFTEYRYQNKRVNVFMDSLVQRLRARTGLLTIPEVKDLLGFHEVTLRDWARAGRLPALRIAGVWRFDPVELAAWVEARRTR